ncbi:MAG TPA: hypothetical protein VIJ93_05760 [bacterium]
MKKRYRQFILGLFLAGVAGPLWAEEMKCARIYITGLQAEHEKGLLILGKGTVAEPEKMSVYITIGRYHGKRALYVQSNFKPPQYQFPIKIAVNDDVDLKTVLFWIAADGKPIHFNSRQVIFYVEPLFLKDPVYGKYKSQMDGKVLILKEGQPGNLVR